MQLIRPDMNVSRIVLAVCVPAGTGAAIHRDRPSHGLAFHCGGDVTYCFSDGAALSARAGHVIYLPRHADYVVKKKTPGDCWAINFQLEEDIAGEPQVWDLSGVPAMLDRFRSAAALWLKKEPFFEIKIKGALYEILYQLAVRARDPLNKSFARIAPAVEYLEAHYTDPDLNVVQLANLCDVSDTYFRRIFTEQFGATPVRYINRKRMQLAAELLAAKMYTVAEVQTMCGFRDACYFSKAFKKYAGCAPAQYRNGGPLPDAALAAARR